MPPWCRLELIDPSSRPDHSNPQNWRASLDVGGTPGGGELTDYDAWTRRYFDPAAPDFSQRSARAADPDGDGLTNEWEQVFAFNPGVPDGSGLRAGLAEIRGATYLSLETDVRPGLAGSIHAESSEELATWSPAGAVLADPITRLSNGRDRVRFRTVAPIGAGSRYLRLAVQP